MAKKSGGGYSSRFVTIDKSTGEVVEGVLAYHAKRVRWAVDDPRGWVLCFQDAFEQLSYDREMTGEIFRVWMNLMSRLGFENFIIINCTEIAEKLKMKPPHVSRAIRKLVEKGLLVKGPKMGRLTAYRLSLEIGWKGSAKAYNENVNQRRSQSAKDLAKERWKVYQQEHLPKEKK